MTPKKLNPKESARKKWVISFEVKCKIIAKHERGVCVDSSKEFQHSTPTLCPILKQNDALKTITPVKGVMMCLKLRILLHEEMKKLLLVWVHKKQLTVDTMTQAIIYEKAQMIYSDFLKADILLRKQWKNT